MSVGSVLNSPERAMALARKGSAMSVSTGDLCLRRRVAQIAVNLIYGDYRLEWQGPSMHQTRYKAVVFLRLRENALEHGGDRAGAHGGLAE